MYRITVLSGRSECNFQPRIYQNNFKLFTTMRGDAKEGPIATSIKQSVDIKREEGGKSTKKKKEKAQLQTHATSHTPQPTIEEQKEFLKEIFKKWNNGKTLPPPHINTEIFTKKGRTLSRYSNAQITELFSQLHSQDEQSSSSSHHEQRTTKKRSTKSKTSKTKSENMNSENEGERERGERGEKMRSAVNEDRSTVTVQKSTKKNNKNTDEGGEGEKKLKGEHEIEGKIQKNRMRIGKKKEGGLVDAISGIGKEETQLQQSKKTDTNSKQSNDKGDTKLKKMNTNHKTKDAKKITRDRDSSSGEVSRSSCSGRGSSGGELDSIGDDNWDSKRGDRHEGNDDQKMNIKERSNTNKKRSRSNNGNGEKGIEENGGMVFGGAEDGGEGNVETKKMIVTMKRNVKIRRNKNEVNEEMNIEVTTVTKSSPAITADHHQIGINVAGEDDVISSDVKRDCNDGDDNNNVVCKVNLDGDEGDNGNVETKLKDDDDNNNNNSGNVEMMNDDITVLSDGDNKNAMIGNEMNMKNDVGGGDDKKKRNGGGGNINQFFEDENNDVEGDNAKKGFKKMMNAKKKMKTLNIRGKKAIVMGGAGSVLYRREVHYLNHIGNHLLTHYLPLYPNLQTDLIHQIGDNLNLVNHLFRHHVVRSHLSDQIATEFCQSTSAMISDNDNDVIDDGFILNIDLIDSEYEIKRRISSMHLVGELYSSVSTDTISASEKLHRYQEYLLAAIGVMPLRYPSLPEHIIRDLPDRSIKTVIGDQQTTYDLHEIANQMKEEMCNRGVLEQTVVGDSVAYALSELSSHFPLFLFCNSVFTAEGKRKWLEDIGIPSICFTEIVTSADDLPHLPHLFPNPRFIAVRFYLSSNNSS